MKYGLIILLCFFMHNTALAGSPLVYSKTIIKIIPSELKPRILERSDAPSKTNNDDRKAKDTKANDLMPMLKRNAKEFTVQVRDLSFLKQRDFIAIQPFNDKEGMMMLVDEGKKARIESSNLLGKFDILFISPDGIIELVAPEISLSGLGEPLESSKDIRAVIFLKSNITEQNDIRPGDRIENDMFKTHPIILE